MDWPILDPDVQLFINAHIGVDSASLALRKNPFPDLEWTEVLNQVLAKSKAKDKLPSWYAAVGIVYPPKLSVEQASSEQTAAYKADIVTGTKLIDLTGGFGVDDYYFAKKINAVTHCEINAALSRIVQHNATVLGIENMECIAGDSFEILVQAGTPFDWIYIDPSRRSDAKGKVFMLRDCQPNVPDLLDTYFKYTDNILIKTAPLLDITAALTELHYVRRIHIVAVGNEVKELLWELSGGYRGPLMIRAVNLLREHTDTFEFEYGSLPEPVIGQPKKYLYEPNSAIMKSGGFNAVSKQFGLNKLQQHSHLYFSDQLIAFPGRVFEVLTRIPYTKPQMKIHLQQGQFNITTRNFPDSVESIRKKWKIKEGGTQYCFFTTDANDDKIVLICSKIK